MPNIKNYLIHLIVFTILTAISLFIVTSSHNLITHVVTVTLKETNKDLKVLSNIKKILLKENINIKKIQKNKKDNKITLELNTKEDSLKITKLLTENNTNNYSINVNTHTSFYLQKLKKNICLGLDLKGGVHFLIKADIKKTQHQNKDIFIFKLHKVLRKNKIKYNIVNNHNEKITLIFRNNKDVSRALRQLKAHVKDYSLLESIDKNTVIISYKDTHTYKNTLMERTIEILKNRIQAMGITEFIVQQQAKDKIIVEIPGVYDIVKAKNILGKIATIEFYLIEENDNNKNKKTIHTKNKDLITVEKNILLTGESVINSYSVINKETHKPAVTVVINKKDAIMFEKITKKNIGKFICIVYKKIKEENVKGQKKKIITEKIISIAKITTSLGDTFQITGLEKKEADNLSLMLKSGALPTNITISEEYLIGPGLSKEHMSSSLYAMGAGLLLIFIFMFFYYGVFGLFANFVICVNLLLLLTTIISFNITLTLYGVAGILLTLGMAIDGNILIYEKIKEEFKKKKTIQESIYNGFNEAVTTILDSNITTLIVGITLYIFSTGVLGCFATTLCLGIFTTLYTTIIVTWLLIMLFLKTYITHKKIPIRLLQNGII